MKFHGQVIILYKDHYDSLGFFKKNSTGAFELKSYINQIDLIKKKLGRRFLKAYIINKDNSKEYIWSSYIWREDLNTEISRNHQKYITYLTDNRPDVTFIGPYKSMRTRGMHLCHKGHEWFIQPIKVKNGETFPRCENKNGSNGEKYITELLSSLKIEFIRELSLKRFGHKQDLRLDFVILQNNYPLFVIEFNGIQHYRPLRSEFFGGYKGFKVRKKRDWIKRTHCWKIGLPVVDIPYSETEEQIRETILYFLNLYELVS